MSIEVKISKPKRRIFDIRKEINVDNRFSRQPLPGTLYPSLQTFDTPSVTFYSALFPEQELLRKDLLNLLSLSRPRPMETIKIFHTTRQAVISDWKIPDHPESRNNADLIKLHKRLGFIWDEFVDGDRTKFMQAAGLPENHELRHLFELAAYRFITVDTLQKRMREASRELADTTFNAQLSLTAGYIQTDIIHFNELPSGVQRRLKKDARQKALNPNRFIVDPAKLGFIGSWLMDEDAYGQVSATHEGKGEVKINIGNSYTLYRIEGEEHHLVDSRYEDSEKNSALIPWMVWARSKRTGNRAYCRGELPSYMTDNIDPRANQRLGLLLATALSPQQRDQLPATYRVTDNEGNEHQQDMEEAQMPLLVYMPRLIPVLMQSSVFDQLEVKSGLKVKSDLVA